MSLSELEFEMSERKFPKHTAPFNALESELLVPFLSFLNVFAIGSTIHRNTQSFTKSFGSMVSALQDLKEDLGQFDPSSFSFVANVCHVLVNDDEHTRSLHGVTIVEVSLMQSHIPIVYEQDEVCAE